MMAGRPPRREVRRHPSARPGIPFLLAVGLTPLLSVACGGDSSTGPEPGDVVLERLTGNEQAGTVGATLPQPLVVRARDVEGFPAEGVQIQFSVTSGGGSVSPSQATTDAEGRTSASWTLGTNAGASQILRASVADGPSDIEFTATAAPGPATQIVKIAGDLQIAQRGGPLGQPVVVEVTDEFGNTVPGESVSFHVTEGSGTVEPAEAPTNENGRASAVWTLGPGLGEQSMTAVIASEPSVAFSATALELPYIGSFVESVAIGNRRTASPRLDDPGTDGSAPSVAVTGIERIVPGGGAFFELTAPSRISMLYVFLEGHDGYHLLELPSSGTGDDDSDVFVYEVITTFGTGIDVDEFRLDFAAGTEAGAGPREGAVLEVYPVDTGPVQVSVAWNASSDVDLYVVDPSNETIYFDSPESMSGGVLSLDSNGGCIGEDIRNESITWPEDPPLRGTYTVRLNLWSSCQQETTDWLVTVRVEGQVTRTVRGRFTGQGDGGDADSGEFITTFSY